MNISCLCGEYRKRGRDALWYADDWLASLGLPPYRWCPAEGAWAPDGYPQGLALAEWRQDGRAVFSPRVLCLPQDLSAGLIVLAAAALEAWGRPVPEELQALAALVLASGAVRWEALP